MPLIIKGLSSTSVGSLSGINALRLPYFLGPYDLTLVGHGHIVNGLHRVLLRPRPYQYAKGPHNYDDKRHKEARKVFALLLIHSTILTEKTALYI